MVGHLHFAYTEGSTKADGLSTTPGETVLGENEVLSFPNMESGVGDSERHLG